MSEEEFIFSLELSGQAGFEGMVNDVARAVLGSVGYAGNPSEALSGAIEQVLAAVGGRTHCVVKFHVHDGKLRIAVSCDGHPGWQTSIALPPS